MMRLRTSSGPGECAFVIPYYGKWPDYFGLWAQSAASNACFDFLIVSDLNEPFELPNNVHIVPMPYSEVASRLSQVLGFHLPHLATYHKLCDFKPFYGLIFADLLKSYAYWGYCDLDLFFGDLGQLWERMASGKFDFISPFEYTVGYCTLLRNEARVNEIALKIPNLHTRALEPDTTYMDEGGVSETAIVAGGFSFCVTESVRDEWRKPRPFLGATADNDGRVIGLPGWFVLHYRDRRVVIYDDQLIAHEALFFHFMGMKDARFWREFSKCDLSRFSFTSFGMTQGLLEPSAKLSRSFAVRCWCAQAPGYTYRAVRSLLPHPIVNRLKATRRKPR